MSNHELYANAKYGFVFNKIDKNSYRLSFPIENQSMVLPKILDFHFIKLIYDLNRDIYEHIAMNIQSDDTATLNLLMKPLFEDLGLPQRFSYLTITKIVLPESVQFVSRTIHERPVNMPEGSELVPIQTMTCQCNIVHDHKVQFVCDVVFENHLCVPPIAEKIIGIVLYKIFRRVQTFMEQVHV